jgi:hypothetical protein
MSRKIHLTNAARRNATVIMCFLKPETPPKMGVQGEPASFKRYLASTDKNLHESLTNKHGEEYADLLINEDPEIDLECIGKTISSTSTVFLTSKGDVMYAAPKIREVIINPDGSEREQREPVEVEPNVHEKFPITWSGKKMQVTETAKKFVFRKTIQLNHVDGLTYDFLYNMAKELSDAGNMMLVGGGEKGLDPLIFQANGKPYRAFLEGRVKGECYQLLLHLSDMELKIPEAKLRK